jgi:endonuclease I
MKNAYFNWSFTAILCLSFLGAAAQDTAYYTPAFNKKGDDLKQALHVLIKNHTEFKYTSSSSTDVWDILKVTDRDTVNPDNVILIYSSRSVNGAQEYNGGQGWTREHVWAKSRGDFGTSEGPGTDVHHLRPCDNNVNSVRNNRNFDNCVSCEAVLDDGIDTGSKKDQNLWTFEPPNEVKGDVARMIFYMAVRYEGTSGEPDLELVSQLLAKTDKSPYQANINTLLEWHANDPVSDWERNRNEIIYNQFQHNRNPFIDFPELASYLWGADTVKMWHPNGEAMGITTPVLPTLNVYPNPANSVVYLPQTVEEVFVLNVQGVRVLEAVNTAQLAVGVLPKGIYILHAKGFAPKRLLIG